MTVCESCRVYVFNNAIAYSFWGHLIPGSWGHRQIGFEQFVSFQFLTTEGLFSIPLVVELLTAHLFVFYYACLSTITPPVALASYAAAGIAGASPFRVGYKGMWIAIVAYIVPFFFIYNPSLLWRGPLWLIFISFVTAVFGCMAIGSAVEGYLLRRANLLERVILFVAGLFLISQGIRESAIGLAAFLVLLGIQYVLIKKAEKKAIPDVKEVVR